MIIFIKGNNDRTTTLKVKSSNTIYSLKQKIQNLDNIPFKQQRLTFLGKQLENEKTLKDYNIKNNSTIYYCIILRGGKPVIMVYTSHPIDVSLTLKLSKTWKFLHTYPKPNLIDEHHLEWKIKTEGSLSGTIYKDEQEFPYLFYDLDVLTKMFTFKNFHCLKRENVVSFLEKALEILGLNRRETTDFITYWIQQVVDKSYTVIEFLSEENYQNIAHLEISPPPKSLIRIFMIFFSTETPLQSTVDMKQWTKRERNDKEYCVVEWGGSNCLNK